MKWWKKKLVKPWMEIKKDDGGIIRARIIDSSETAYLMETIEGGIFWATEEELIRYGKGRN